MFSKEFEIELTRAAHKNSFFEFFKWAFCILNPGEEYEDAPHISVICSIAQKEIERVIRNEEANGDFIINIPPRASKTLIMSVCLNAWTWTLKPDLNFICVSFDETLVLMNAGLTKDLIKSPEYQHYYKDVYQIRKDSDAKELYTNNKGGYRLSKTTGSNITGFSGCILIIDDPQNPKTAESEVLRKTSIDYYEKALYNRKTPVRIAVIFIIMQRLQEQDLSGHLLKKNPELYNHICLPAILSNKVYPRELKSLYSNEGLLDPKRLPQKILDSFKKVLGGRGFAGQYEQVPYEEKGQIFSRDWFEIIEPSSITRDPINCPINFIIDSAYTSKQENDATAILTCFRIGRYLFILDVVQVWMTFPDLIRFLKEYTRGMGYTEGSKIYIEPKASGISIVQQLQAETSLNVIESAPPKEDKVTRAHAITPVCEARRVKIVKGTGFEIDFLDQLVSFSPIAKRDDMVDTLINGIREILLKSEEGWFI